MLTSLLWSFLHSSFPLFSHFLLTVRCFLKYLSCQMMTMSVHSFTLCVFVIIKFNPNCQLAVCWRVRLCMSGAEVLHDGSVGDDGRHGWQGGHWWHHHPGGNEQSVEDTQSSCWERHPSHSHQHHSAHSAVLWEGRSSIQYNNTIIKTYVVHSGRL